MVRIKRSGKKIGNGYITDYELEQLDKRLSKYSINNSNRRKQRNPSEWKYLKKWEWERRGEKIGEIGPPPAGLEDFDPQSWNPEDEEEDLSTEVKAFDQTLEEGMNTYTDALNDLKDR